MIGTVTLNPSIDQYVIVDRIVKGDTVRAKKVRKDPGGKGINVSRMIVRLGGETKAFGFSGGNTGRMLKEFLDEERVPHDLVNIRQDTRINIFVREKEIDHLSRISVPGPEVNKKELKSFLRKFSSASPFPGIWVMGGSLAKGVPSWIYRELSHIAKKRGSKCILDADGEALKLGIEAFPYMIKPNQFELQRLLRREIKNESQIIFAGKELIHHGIEVVVISRGEHGVLVVTKDHVFKAMHPKVKVRSIVGAGDSMLGAIAWSLAQGNSLGEAVCWGVAAGTASVLTPGTELALKKDVERIRKRVRCEILK
jgi:1-phosphofructokinase